jgi:hypothetical protein
MGIQRAAIMIIVGALAWATANGAYAGKIVSWVDEKGVTHFTDAGLANGQANAVTVASSDTPARSAPADIVPEQKSTPTVARSGSGKSAGQKSGLRGYRSSWARDPDRFETLN